MTKFLIIIIATFSTTIFAQATNESFIELAKKTSTVFSGSAQVDINNAEKVIFETLLDNQKVYLKISSDKLNSTVYTLINSDSNLSKKFKSPKALPLPPVVNSGKLDISIDLNSLCSNTGAPAVSTDTSCVGKDCNLNQLIISKCNDLNCWKNDSSLDRNFLSGLGGAFELNEKIDISKCLTNNNEGVKHELTFSEVEPTKGGTVRYQVILQNDMGE